MIRTRQARSHGWIFDASQGCLYQGFEPVCARTPGIKNPMAAAVNSSFVIALLDRSPEGLRYIRPNGSLIAALKGCATYWFERIARPSANNNAAGRNPR